MLESVPQQEELVRMMGADAFSAWESICHYITETYEMETLWGKGGKAGPYEYKFRRGGKTLCALYPRDQDFGFMVIFGKAEREKFEAARGSFSTEIQRIYEESTTYHDGKWMMFSIRDLSLLDEMKKLLLIKRKPNRRGN